MEIVLLIYGNKGRNSVKALENPRNIRKISLITAFRAGKRRRDVKGTMFEPM